MTILTSVTVFVMLVSLVSTRFHMLMVTIFNFRPSPISPAVVTSVVVVVGMSVKMVSVPIVVASVRVEITALTVIYVPSEALFMLKSLPSYPFGFVVFGDVNLASSKTASKM